MMFFKRKEDSAKNYRKIGLETNYSNYGWYTCAHCGKKLRKGDLDIDHILPRSKGGTNDPRNLQCLCVHCNRSKGADTSSTKKDLKKRKVSYAEAKRAPYFREKIKEVKRDFRMNDLPKCKDEDLVELLQNQEMMSVFGAGIRSEARKRGLIK